jgi:hypothetical protein
MKRYAYTGEKAPALIPVCVYEGWLDAVVYDMTQLYRHPTLKVIGWLIGNRLGKLWKRLF